MEGVEPLPRRVSAEYGRAFVELWQLMGVAEHSLRQEEAQGLQSGRTALR
jgi:hypothetical protein